MTTHDIAPVLPTPDARLDELAARLGGTLCRPGDAAWADASAAWNLAVPQQPAAVVQAASAADIVATVDHALRHGIPVAAQPGGHGATTALDGAIVVRTGALDDIWIDADQAVARVGAGVKWGALQSALDGSGFTGPLGSSPDVTVTGFCLGGGLSWFSRSCGVGAVSVRAAEIVDGAGRHRWIDDTDEPELMWALRGGGGDYVIVTALEINLVPAPEITGGRLVFDAAEAEAVWRAFAEVTSGAPEQLTMFTSVLHFPPLPELPAEIRGRSLCVVDAVILGGPTMLETWLSPIRRAGTVLRDTMRPLAPSDVGDVCEEPVDPTPALTATSSLAVFDGAVIDSLRGVAADPGSGLLQVQIRHLGGALRRPQVPGAGAGVDAGYAVMGLAMVPFPEAAPPALAGLDHLLRTVGPWHAGPLTLSMLGDTDDVSSAFTSDVRRRLRQVKSTHDPAGIIRGNRPVG